MKYLYFLENFLKLKDLFFLKKEKFFKKIDLLNFNINKLKNNKKNNKNLFLKFLGITFKGGLKIQVLNKYLKIIKIFFYLFNKNYINIFNKNLNFYIMMYYFFKSILSFNNINFIFNWIISIIKPIFYIKCVKVNKKFKKKFKKKFNFYISYLPNKKREFIGLKWLYLNNNNFNGNNYFDRFLKNFLDIFLNVKNSKLFIKKKLIIKKFFKKF